MILRSVMLQAGPIPPVIISGQFGARHRAASRLSMPRQTHALVSGMGKPPCGATTHIPASTAFGRLTILTQAETPVIGIAPPTARGADRDPVQAYAGYPAAAVAPTVHTSRTVTTAIVLRPAQEQPFGDRQVSVVGAGLPPANPVAGQIAPTEWPPPTDSSPAKGQDDVICVAGIRWRRSGTSPDSRTSLRSPVPARPRSARRTVQKTFCPGLLSSRPLAYPTARTARVPPGFTGPYGSAI